MSKDMECPYCGSEQEVCHDDGDGYTENRRHEHTCSSCDKTFVFTTAISFHYEPFKADCLNGSQHQLAFRESWPKQYSRMGCKDCDFERIATTEEIDSAIPKEQQP